MSEEQTTYDLNGTAVLAARLNAMTVRMADLEERIDRLIIGQRELREQRNDDVLERLTEAVELIGECVRRDPFGAPYLAIGDGDRYAD